MKLVRSLFYTTAGGESAAVNHKGQVYLASYIGREHKRQWAVSIFTRGASKLVKQITNNLTTYPARLAVSSLNDLYVSIPRSVLLYPNSDKARFKRLKKDAHASVAFDAADDAYVGTFNSVNIYPPGQSEPSQTIKNSVQIVKSIAIDSTGNVYVGSTNNIGCGGVTVYAAGSFSLLYTITDGICEPVSLAFDSSDNLYVANAGDLGSGGDDVTVYARGSQQILAQIAAPSPTSIVLDSAENVYVATPTAVDVYAAGTYQQVATIPSSKNQPIALAWGPK